MNLDLILDTPWWLPAAMALVGISLWVSGNKRRDKALMSIGVVVLVTTVALVALSYFIDTPSERAEKSTRAFVAAVVEHDPDTLRGILSRNAYVKVSGGTTLYANRDEILLAVDRAHQQLGLKSASILGINANQTDDVITVIFSVLSDQSVTMGRPIQTRWEFQYQRTADGWSLWGITLLAAPQGMSPSQAQREFPTVR